MLAKVCTFMICPKLPPRCRMMNAVEKEASVDCSASRCFLASLFYFPLKLKLRFSQQGKFVQICRQVTAESQLFSIPGEAVAAALWLPLP